MLGNRHPELACPDKGQGFRIWISVIKILDQVQNDNYEKLNKEFLPLQSCY